MLGEGGKIVCMHKNVDIGEYGEHVTSTFFRVWFVVGRRGLAKRVLFVCSYKAENCE